MKNTCNHDHSLRYARRVFSNGTVHYCVQCTRCLDVVKTARHGYRLFIRHDEIPSSAVIFEWIDPSCATGGLFDDN
jgi:hypothetical protein